jgi:hydrogenase maturation protein HypF
VLQRLMARSIQAPRTTSAGRLFDAVAAITGIRDRNRFEGDAASALEFAAEGVDTAEPYAGFVRPGDSAVVDWGPLVSAILEDSELGCSPAAISARFHEGLAALVEDVAARVGVQRVVLTGGCFQNVLLARRTCERLRRRGLDVYTPRCFPPNDGGISLGQALVASRRFLQGGAPCA